MWYQEVKKGKASKSTKRRWTLSLLICLNRLIILNATDFAVENTKNKDGHLEFNDKYFKFEVGVAENG